MPLMLGRCLDEDKVRARLLRGDLLDFSSGRFRIPDFLRGGSVVSDYQETEMRKTLINLPAGAMGASFLERCGSTYIERTFARRKNPDGSIGGFVETTQRNGIPLVVIGENVFIRPNGLIMASAPFSKPCNVLSDVYSNLEVGDYEVVCGNERSRYHPKRNVGFRYAGGLSKYEYESWEHGPVIRVGETHLTTKT